MRIGFDAKRLFHNHSGLGVYSRTLVRGIEELGEDDIFLFAPYPKRSSFKEFLSNQYTLVQPGMIKVFWRYSGMSKDIRSSEVDVYHGLSNEIPRISTSSLNTKFVVSVHDLIFEKHPEFYPFLDRKIYREKVKRSCLTSDKVIAISKSTKKDLIELYNIAEEKIEVVYPFPSSFYFQDIAFNDSQNASNPYALFIGTSNKRKNLLNVLKAFSKIEIKKRIELRIIGRIKENSEELKLIKKNKLQRWVTIESNVDDQRLYRLYREAEYLIYPSLYEGFGIPVLEAQLVGTPVITSHLSSLPEVVRKGSLMIDPTSIKDIYEAMIQLSNSPIRIEISIIKELQRTFSPDASIKKIRKIYKEL